MRMPGLITTTGSVLLLIAGCAGATPAPLPTPSTVTFEQTVTAAGCVTWTATDSTELELFVRRGWDLQTRQRARRARPAIREH